MKSLVMSLLMLGVTSAVVQAAEIEGVLDWSQRAVLSTPVSGVVQAVKVKEGDEVKAGDVLLQLDRRGFLAHLEQAKAQEQSLSLELEEANKEWERAQELYDRTVLSDHELATAKVNQSVAAAAYASAKAVLVQAELNAQYSEIKAPFDGLIVQRMVEPGQVVSNDLQAVPMLTIADHKRMVLSAYVKADKLGKIKIGQSVSLETDSKSFQGKVSSIGYEPEDQGYLVKVEFDASTHQLRKGAIAKAKLP